MQIFIFFTVMAIFGIFFNAMNVLLYSPSHFYLSPTLIYSGCFMASTMFCAHEIIHFFTKSHCNIQLFILGIVLSLFFAFLLRKQVGINSASWMRRMIPHHSTALTTSTQLLRNNPAIGEFPKKLAENIITTQEEEISAMKKYLEKN